MEQKIQGLIAWIRENTPRDIDILVPISGGSDSALCFWLYTTVFPSRTVGIHFGAELRCQPWFEKIGIVRLLPQPTELESREVARWAQLLDIALSEHRILIGTRNRTEQVIGTYGTASRIAFHQPLAGVWKSDILSLCEHVGIPEEIILSSKEADLVCGRPEELARIPFAVVDAFCRETLDGTVAEELNADQRMYLEDLHRKNSFKSVLPVMGPEL